MSPQAYRRKGKLRKLEGHGVGDEFARRRCGRVKGDGLRHSHGRAIQKSKGKSQKAKVKTKSAPESIGFTICLVLRIAGFALFLFIGSSPPSRLAAIFEFPFSALGLSLLTFDFCILNFDLFFCLSTP
jgi:hypothetical protein